MKIFISDQQPRFKQHLALIKSLNTVPYNKERLKYKYSEYLLEANPINLSQLSNGILFSYKLFPSNILTSYSEWTDESRFMREGDTIVQQIYIPPFPSVSQKI